MKLGEEDENLFVQINQFPGHSEIEAMGVGERSGKNKQTKNIIKSNPFYCAHRNEEHKNVRFLSFRQHREQQTFSSMKSAQTRKSVYEKKFERTKKHAKREKSSHRAECRAFGFQNGLKLNERLGKCARRERNVPSARIAREIRARCRRFSEYLRAERRKRIVQSYI